MTDAINSVACLVPLRNGIRLTHKASSLGNDTNPFITLKGDHVVLGRRELIKTMRAACGCSSRCHNCRRIEKWAMVRLSRQMIQISASKLVVRGPNVSIVTVSKPNRQPRQLEEPCSNGDWKVQASISIGDVISFSTNRKGDAPFEFQVVHPSDCVSVELKPSASDRDKGKKRPNKKRSRIVPEKGDSKITPREKISVPVSETSPFNKMQDESKQLPTCLAISDETSKEPKQEKFKLFFLPLGRSMPPKRIEILKASAERKGAIVVGWNDGPSHLVLDKSLPAEAVAKFFSCSKVEHLAQMLREKSIIAVIPDWVAHAGTTLTQPTFQQFWQRMPYGRGGTKTKRKSRESKGASAKRSRPAVSTHVFRGDGNETDSQQLPAIVQTETTTPRGRNAGLSELFSRLSKLHADCPLQAQDEWKAYTLSMIAGRLRNLDFEIIDDDIVLARVHSLNGFGASTMSKIREYLKTGTCQRIKEFEKDPMRVAMERLTHIWGVGKMKAKDLLNKGYKTIAEVRAGVASGEINDFSENQLIGLDCYEDFRDKMDPEEVAMIGDIVTKACHERYPHANVTIMGSYRRKKPHSGDIDILITHPGFVATTPRGAISELVDRLAKRGHIAHHLTSLYGLNEGDDSSDGSQDYESTEAAVDGYPSSSMYMGVFFSPLVKGRRRRIDIKFYPYRERVFASLYFTGNGHFNRSMRLYATRAKGLLLNDHGLFPRQSNMSIPHPSDKLLLEPSTEKEVFDFLGLVYQEPHERDCFDAVIPKDESVRNSLCFEELNQSELKRDRSNHQWIE